MTYAIRVSGLRELDRAFKSASPGVQAGLRREIREATKIVSNTAKQVALFRGLEDSGALIRSIRGGMRGINGVVRVTATNKGYPYPRRYEYGGRGVGESVGPRAFLAPAVRLDAPIVARRIENMLEGVHRTARLT